MGSPKKHFAVDPDYQMSEAVWERKKQKNERELKEKTKKIRETINRQFQLELDNRRRQLDFIQQRINHAQKTLHMLRYVIITSYYNNPELEIVKQDEQSSKMIELPTLDNSKKRIHPALKKLIINESEGYHFNIASSPRKRPKVMNFVASKKRKVDKIEEENNEEEIASETDVKDLKKVEQEYDSSRNRRKVVRTVIIGNISKWMPSESEEDKSTHKWMVYVRGPKENPNVTGFISKVIFYLHPSYQPNDVVEIRESPFHLARRGWGEFPLRVRIVFKDRLNKPVDVIHNLKLDKTYTGRQTLGTETIVNLHLHDENNSANENVKECNATDNNSAPYIKIEPGDKTIQHSEKVALQSIENDNKIKIEPGDIETNDTEEVYTESQINACNFEHDYCSHESRPADNTDATSSSRQFLTEHSYFSNGTESSVKNGEEHSQVNACSMLDPTFGIVDSEESNTNNGIVEEAVLYDSHIMPQLHMNKVFYTLKKIETNAGMKIVAIKRRRPQEPLLKTVYQKKSKDAKGAIVHLSGNKNGIVEHKIVENRNINYEKYKIYLPTSKIKNVNEAMFFLLKRLPIVTSLAADNNYKCTYPYAAKSMEEFRSWNLAKRYCAEWNRAKIVQLQISHLPDSSSLTTKSIILFARAHGFTPLTNYKSFKNVNSTLFEQHWASNSNSVGNNSSNINMKTEIDVDVINCATEPSVPAPKNCIKLVDMNLQQPCSYIKQIASRHGVNLKLEEISPGVLFNSAERVMLQACMSLAENIVRIAHSDLALQSDFNEQTSNVQVENIIRALYTRPELSFLLQT